MEEGNYKRIQATGCSSQSVHARKILKIEMSDSFPLFHVQFNCGMVITEISRHFQNKRR